MATTFTTVYSLDKPAVGDSGWGPLRNTNMDDIDAELARMRVPYISPSIGATTTLDLNQSTGARVFLLTVTQITTIAFSNVPSSSFAVRWHLRLTNGSAFAVSWPASVTWLNGPPSLRLSGVDWIEFWSTDGGTTVYGRLMNGAVAHPRSNTDSGTGANTAETTLKTIPVPAGAMGTNGVLRVTVAYQTTGTGNTKTLRIKYGGTTFLASTTAAGDNGNGIAQCWIANQNSASVQISAGWHTAFSDGDITNVGQTAGAINSANAQDVTVTGQTPTGADEITVKFAIVEILPS